MKERDLSENRKPEKGAAIYTIYTYIVPVAVQSRSFFLAKN
jgi:hypothetical protein